MNGIDCITYSEADSMIKELSKYMLTTEIVLHYNAKEIINSGHETVSTSNYIDIVTTNNCSVEKQQKNTGYYPKIEDTLFWCIFIHKFSKTEFLEIETKYKNREIVEKMKIIDFLADGMKLKHMKISKTGCQEIRGDLSCSNKTNLFALHAVCVFYNIHAFIVNNENKTFIEYNKNEDNHDQDTCIIYKNGSLLNENQKNSKYSIDLNVTHLKIQNIQEDFFQFHNYNKPLKPISTYKIIDLEKIASKMLVYEDISKKNKLKKKDLYEAICAQII
jgi:hypothetical protein